MLELDDLATIEGLGDGVKALKDGAFVQMLKGTALEAHLPLGDADASAGPLALADDPAHELALAPVHVRPTFARQPVVMELSDGRIARVHFDKHTHSSRRQRALTECRLHGRCRCDRFLDELPSEVKCVAWMFAWHEAGRAIEAGEGRALEHRHCHVSEEAVNDCATRVRMP